MVSWRNMKKILLVEDERITQAVTRKWLLDLGFDVVVTGDGGAVVGLIEQQQPDLVLLDLGLDDSDPFSGATFDGFRVMEWLRHRSGRFPRVPIIVITGREEPGLKERVLTAGAVAFFKKPPDKGRLLTAIDVALQ